MTIHAQTGGAKTIETGTFHGKVHNTSGRARIYQEKTDFKTSNGPDVHVLLALGDDENLHQEIVKGKLDSIELGSLKGNQGDQNYDLQPASDLDRYNAVVRRVLITSMKETVSCFILMDYRKRWARNPMKNSEKRTCPHYWRLSEIAS